MNFLPFAKKVPTKLLHTYYHDFISGIYFGIYGSVVFVLGPFILKKGFQMNNWLISLIISGPLVGMLLSPFVSEIVQHTKKKPFMTTLAILGRGLIMLIVIPMPKIVIAVIVAVGEVIAILTFPIYTSIMKLNYPDDYRGRIMAYVRVGISAITIIFSAVTGYVLKNYNYLIKYLFFIGGLAGVLAGIEFNKIIVKDDEKFPNTNFKIIKDNIKIKKVLKSILNTLKKNIDFKKFIILYSLYNIGINIVNLLIPIYFETVLKLPYDKAGFILGVFPFIAGIITYVLWGNLVDKNNPIKFLSISFFVLSLGIVLFPLYHSLISSGMAMVIFSVIRVGMDILGITAILFFCLPEESGIFMGTNLFFAGLIGTITPYVAVFFLNIIKIDYMFFISAFFIFVSSLFLFLWYIRDKSLMFNV